MLQLNAKSVIRWQAESVQFGCLVQPVPASRGEIRRAMVRQLADELSAEVFPTFAVHQERATTATVLSPLRGVIAVVSWDHPRSIWRCFRGNPTVGRAMEVICRSGLPRAGAVERI